MALPDAGPKWHSDLSYVATPALGSMLYALEVPDHGGNTGFANMYDAYETLPDDLRQALDGTRAVFLPGRSQKNGADFQVGFSTEQKDRVPPGWRIRCFARHPETGRKSVFANPQHTIGIEGMDDSESRPASGSIVRPLRPGPVHLPAQMARQAIWYFGIIAAHYILQTLSRVGDPAYQRHMHRTTIMGDRPV